jgi:N-acetyl sugar amidotransferase
MIKFQQCIKCVMDTSDPLIYFDKEGVCNHCKNFEKKYAEIPKVKYTDSIELRKVVSEIKLSSINKKYDCILGLSGGVDSSFIATILKELNIKPLVVHFDNGWNSELAIRNIQNIVNKLGFELYTYVIDWNEFKDLQLSYFRASVLDLEVPTDHLIFGALYKTAKKFGIKNIISGYNLSSEGIMPESWLHMRKFDIANMKDIHEQFGSGKLKKLPILGFWHRIYYNKIYKFKEFHILQNFEYNKLEAKKVLSAKFDWKDYGGKHYESVFTRFYQGYFLPVKFNIDKRKAHLSSLILSSQMNKDDALNELKMPTYDSQVQERDIDFVCKKWNISRSEFDRVMNLPIRRHQDFKDEIILENRYNSVINLIKKILKSS